MNDGANNGLIDTKLRSYEQAQNNMILVVLLNDRETEFGEFVAYLNTAMRMYQIATNQILS